MRDWKKICLVRDIPVLGLILAGASLSGFYLGFFLAMSVATVALITPPRRGFLRCCFATPSRRAWAS